MKEDDICGSILAFRKRRDPCYEHETRSADRVQLEHGTGDRTMRAAGKWTRRHQHYHSLRVYRSERPTSMAAVTGGSSWFPSSEVWSGCKSAVPCQQKEGGICAAQTRQTSSANADPSQRPAQGVGESGRTVFFWS